MEGYESLGWEWKEVEGGDGNWKFMWGTMKILLSARP